MDLKKDKFFASIENIVNHYGLHDSIAKNGCLCDNSFSLIFPEGVYLLDYKGKESEITKHCNLKIFWGKPEENIDSRIKKNICVKQILKNKVVEIPFKLFLESIKKEGFDIEQDFYSFFDYAILLKGFVGNRETQIEICGIEKIEIEF